MTEPEEWTVKKLLEWTTEYFTKNGSESSRLDAEILLSHVLNWSRIQLYTDSRRHLQVLNPKGIPKGFSFDF